MAGSDGGRGGEELGSTSPRNRVKFLCSHGGKILPRPADGHLKYVGGETRVIAVPRDISFSELMKRLTALIGGDMVLKYQIIPEDLDALVSVRSDDDIKFMLDEYDRHEGTSMLRTFLFPSTPIVIENQMATMDPHAFDQRYVDALNGIIRTTANVKFSAINANSLSFTISSACSSPKTPSPDCISQINDPVNQEAILLNAYHNSRNPVHRVQSSPSICSLNNPHNHHIHQYQHQYYQNHQPHHQHQQNHHYHHQSPKLPQDPHKSNGIQRLVPTLSIDRAELNRGYMGHGLNHYYSTIRHQRGSGGCNKCGYLDECSAYECARLDRDDSLPRSPRTRNKPAWE